MSKAVFCFWSCISGFKDRIQKRQKRNEGGKLALHAPVFPLPNPKHMLSVSTNYRRGIYYWRLRPEWGAVTGLEYPRLRVTLELDIWRFPRVLLVTLT